MARRIESRASAAAAPSTRTWAPRASSPASGTTSEIRRATRNAASGRAASSDSASSTSAAARRTEPAKASIAALCIKKEKNGLGYNALPLYRTRPRDISIQRPAEQVFALYDRHRRPKDSGLRNRHLRPESHPVVGRHRFGKPLRAARQTRRPRGPARPAGQLPGGPGKLARLLPARAGGPLLASVPAQARPLSLDPLRAAGLGGLEGGGDHPRHHPPPLPGVPAEQPGLPLRPPHDPPQPPPRRPHHRRVAQHEERPHASLRGGRPEDRGHPQRRRGRLPPPPADRGPAALAARPGG